MNPIIYFYWNEDYLKSIQISGRDVFLNISNFHLLPSFVKSLRRYEVNILPSSEEEKAEAEIIRNILNRYGVVHLTKNILKSKELNKGA